ncbi:MAG: hypothetical protein HKN04_02455 [Rhodothermaceae bacterium]|nr:hypothetical protein [Rhodothermaceae bacterium]
MIRSVLLLMFAFTLALGVQAQTAVDYYHGAARLYIEGANAQAEQVALQGLALAPDDARLQALLDRIREQEQQQSGQGEQQNQDDNENQQRGEEGEASDEGEQSGDQQQPQDGEQGQQDQPQDDQSAASDRPEEEQAEPEASQSGQPQDGEREEELPPDAQQRPGEGEETPEQMMSVEPGQMTQEEAERILSAVGANEGALLRQVQRRPGRGRRVEKDW